MYSDLSTSIRQVKQYLHGPLIFHNNPPSTIRPRHRNDRVASQITRDSSGREHLLLNFFVQGQVPGAEPVFDSRWAATVDWTKRTTSKLADTSFDEIVEGTKRYSEDAWESCKRLFKFLSGDPLPPSRPPPPPTSEQKQEKQESGWKGGLTGLFSGLRGSSKDAPSASEDGPDGQVYTEGEVHADLVMVCDAC